MHNSAVCRYKLRKKKKSTKIPRNCSMVAMRLCGRVRYAFQQHYSLISDSCCVDLQRIRKYINLLAHRCIYMSSSIARNIASPQQHPHSITTAQHQPKKCINHLRIESAINNCKLRNVPSFCLPHVLLCLLIVNSRMKNHQNSKPYTLRGFKIWRSSPTKMHYSRYETL